MNDDAEKRPEIAKLDADDDSQMRSHEDVSHEQSHPSQGSAARQQSEDDEETWTNQPAVSEEGLLPGDLDEVEDDEPDVSPAPRRAIETARDVVCEEIPHRAQKAAARLKPFLTGAFVFEFSNSGEKFLLDWRGDVAAAKQIPQAVSVTTDEAQGFVFSEEVINVDSVIIISEAHLMAIRAGTLNPQVAMLTEKIRVKGKVSPAVYIFNVVAPRIRT